MASHLFLTHHPGHHFTFRQPCIAYAGILFSWSLSTCHPSGELFTREIRHILYSQEETLFQPIESNRLRFCRPFVLMQEWKLSFANNSQFASEALQYRGHMYPYKVQQPCTSFGASRHCFLDFKHSRIWGLGLHHSRTLTST